MVFLIQFLFLFAYLRENDVTTPGTLPCSVLSHVEMATKDVPCCAAEGETNVILKVNPKLSLSVTLELVRNGKQENGAR